MQKNLFAMPNIRSLVSFSTIIIVSCFSAFEALAQYPPGVQAAFAQHHQQFVNQQMSTMMLMNMNRNWGKYAGQGDEYIVKLKNGERKTFTSTMYMDTVLHKNFLVFVNKKFKKSDSVNRFQKIYPHQTSAIGLVIDYNEEDPRIGLPTDSGWNIKVIKGAINIYAKSGNYLNVVSVPAFGSPKMDFAASEIIGIQLKGGAIEKLSKENVLKAVAGNARATAFVEKKGLYESVKKYNLDAENAAIK
jgi:hypothetical protein